MQCACRGDGGKGHVGTARLQLDLAFGRDHRHEWQLDRPCLADLRRRRSLKSSLTIDSGQSFNCRPSASTMGSPRPFRAITPMSSAAKEHPSRHSGAMRMLEYEAYRPGLHAKMGSKPEMLAQAAAVFGHAKAFLLIRPRGFEHLEETVATLRKHWDALGR
jgi:hypothetical protein